MIYIGLDDTDMPETRGTGHLARSLAKRLESECRVRGVSRHQLLDDPRIPKTKNNSANVVHVAATELSLGRLAEIAQQEMEDNFIPGSDPGLCVVSRVSPSLDAFGRKAKTTIVSQVEAHESIGESNAILRGLGGTCGGVIGAAAGTALAASGTDGRFVLYGTIRELAGTVSIADVLSAGVSAVRTSDGETLTEGRIACAEKVRPEIIDGQAVVLVTPGAGGVWQAVRRD